MDYNTFNIQEEQFLKISKEIDEIVYKKSVDSEKIQMEKLFNDMHILLDEMHKSSNTETERVITSKYKDLLTKYNETFKFMVNENPKQECKFSELMKKFFRVIFSCVCCKHE